MVKYPIRKQKFILDKQWKQLVINNDIACGDNSKIVVKYFNPVGIGTWYLYSINPKTNIAFGVATITNTELGTIDFNELRDLVLDFGLGIERDAYYPTNKHTIGEILNANWLGRHTSWYTS